MKDLIYKEFKLSLHPTMLLFPPLAAMLLIPSYPYYVTFFYSCMAVCFTFLFGRENQDIYYTALLPIFKRDVVKARTCTVVFFQLLHVLLSAAFAALNLRLWPNGSNSAGIEPNLAFFGLSLVMLGGFNLCFLPAFYKTAYKLLRPVVSGFAFFTVFFLLAEGAAQYVPSPLRAFLDTRDPAMAVRHLPILLVGALLYALLTLLACRRAEANFERVDL